MHLGKTSSENKGKQNVGLRATPSLFLFLEEEINQVDNFYQNLDAKYDRNVYEQFEKRFIYVRNQFKSKLQNIADPDYDFVNRTEMRKKAVEQILTCCTSVAEQFRVARENDYLDRPACTDVLEDLIFAIGNFKHIIKEQGNATDE